MDTLHDTLRGTQSAIDRLKELQRGWNSYGGSMVDLTSREHAKAFLYDAAHALGPAYWSPKVGATADGGIALVWRKPGVPTKAEALFSPAGDRFIVFRRREILARGPIKGPEFLKLVVAA